MDQATTTSGRGLAVSPPHLLPWIHIYLTEVSRPPLQASTPGLHSRPPLQATTPGLTSVLASKASALPPPPSPSNLRRPSGGAFLRNPLLVRGHDRVESSVRTFPSKQFVTSKSLAPAKAQPKHHVYQKVEFTLEPKARLLLVLKLLTTQDTAGREDNQPTVPTTIESKLIDSPLSSSVHREEVKLLHFPSKHAQVNVDHLKARQKSPSLSSPGPPPPPHPDAKQMVQGTPYHH